MPRKGALVLLLVLVGSLPVLAGDRIADRFIYYPLPVPDGWSAQAAGLEGASDCAFEAADGVKLTGRIGIG